MKCSSQRNYDRNWLSRCAAIASILNEVQFPKKLQLEQERAAGHGWVASMKCSSRRNCDAIIVYAEANGHKPQ